MKKILVTGATGFIGNYVVDELLRGGFQVIASSAHPEKARSAPWFGRVEYIPFDLQTVTSGPDYYSILGKPDSLIHLAWEGLPNYKADFHLASNFPRHAEFLRNLVRNGLEDMTVVGTCFEYGMQQGCLSEDMPALPANPYAKAKDQLRRYLQDLIKEVPFTLRWTRLFYMFGKGQNPNSLLSQLDRALDAGEGIFNMSGGEQLRDYLPVEKVAEYLVRIALQQKVTGIINCCSGRPITIKELVKEHLLLRNKSISLNLGYYPYPDYEPMEFWGDSRKLESIYSLSSQAGK